MNIDIPKDIDELLLSLDEQEQNYQKLADKTETVVQYKEGLIFGWAAKIIRRLQRENKDLELKVNYWMKNNHENT